MISWKCGVFGIPEHFIPAFKPSKEFMKDIKNADIKIEPKVEAENED